MPRRVSEISIQFKVPPRHLFKTVECDGDIFELVEARLNQLVLRIQPSESISLTCSAKHPGMQYQIQPVNLDFTFEEGLKKSALPEAYKRLLLDVLRGDFTMFMRNDELDAAWRLVTPVFDAWSASSERPKGYAAGT
jgi:glucose-6-phosphate 1-dehydrogenase